MVSGLLLEVIESDDERFRRLHAEAIKGAKLALECFAALKEIRDDELWRLDGWESYDAYLKESFAFTRSYANKLIAAVECKNRIEQVVPGKCDLTNEAQLRELQTVPEAHLKDVLDEAKEIAAESGKDRVTAATLRRARKRVLGDNHKKRKKPEPVLKVEVEEDSLKVQRVKRIANESLDKLELQLSHLLLRKKWQATLDKIREEVLKA